MKKIFVIALMACTIGFGNRVFAQQVQIGLGGGICYGNEIKSPGIDLRADFQLPKGWVITPNLNFFFPRHYNNNTKHTWSTFNLDVHYLFALSSQANFYPLAGFNYTSVTNKVRDARYTFNNAGMNLGMGLNAMLGGRLKGFVEVKYVISNDATDEAVVTFGVVYGL